MDGDGTASATDSAVELPARATSVSAARDFVVEVGRRLGARDSMIEELALVVSELATNAVQAAPESTFEVGVVRRGHGLAVRVTSKGDATDIPDRADWQPDEPLAVRGRGLEIVDHVSDEVSIEADDTYVSVIATLRFDRQTG